MAIPSIGNRVRPFPDGTLPQAPVTPLARGKGKEMAGSPPKTDNEDAKAKRAAYLATPPTSNQKAGITHVDSDSDDVQIIPLSSTSKSTVKEESRVVKKRKRSTTPTPSRGIVPSGSIAILTARVKELETELVVKRTRLEMAENVIEECRDENMHLKGVIKRLNAAQGIE